MKVFVFGLFAAAQAVCPPEESCRIQAETSSGPAIDVCFDPTSQVCLFDGMLDSDPSHSIQNGKKLCAVGEVVCNTRIPSDGVCHTESEGMCCELGWFRHEENKKCCNEIMVREPRYWPCDAAQSCGVGYDVHFGVCVDPMLSGSPDSKMEIKNQAVCPPESPESCRIQAETSSGPAIDVCFDPTSQVCLFDGMLDNDPSHSVQNGKKLCAIGEVVCNTRIPSDGVCHTESEGMCCELGWFRHEENKKCCNEIMVREPRYWPCDAAQSCGTGYDVHFGVCVDPMV